MFMARLVVKSRDQLTYVTMKYANHCMFNNKHDWEGSLMCLLNEKESVHFGLLIFFCLFTCE